MSGVAERTAVIAVGPHSVVPIGQKHGAVGPQRHVIGIAPVIDMGGVAEGTAVIAVGPQSVIITGQKDGAVGAHRYP